MQNKWFLAGTQFSSPHNHLYIDENQVIAGYGINCEKALKPLNDDYQSRQFEVLRHRENFLIAKEIQSKSISSRSLVYSNEDRGHTDLISERVIYGKPDFSSDKRVSYGQAESEYTEGDMLFNIIREYMVEKRIAIDGYLDIVQYFDIQNPMMQRLINGLES